jgi:hypothetical protein
VRSFFNVTERIVKIGKVISALLLEIDPKKKEKYLYTYYHIDLLSYMKEFFSGKCKKL